MKRINPISIRIPQILYIMQYELVTNLDLDTN